MQYMMAYPCYYGYPVQQWPGQQMYWQYVPEGYVGEMQEEAEAQEAEAQEAEAQEAEAQEEEEEAEAREEEEEEEEEEEAVEEEAKEAKEREQAKKEEEEAWQRLEQTLLVLENIMHGKTRAARRHAKQKIRKAEAEELFQAVVQNAEELKRDKEALMEEVKKAHTAQELTAGENDILRSISRALNQQKTDSARVHVLEVEQLKATHLAEVNRLNRRLDVMTQLCKRLRLDAAG
jgi:hypothetical protein